MEKEDFFTNKHGKNYRKLILNNKLIYEKYHKKKNLLRIEVTR